MLKILLSALTIIVCILGSTVRANTICPTPLSLSEGEQFKDSVKEAQKAYDALCESLSKDDVKYTEIYLTLNHFHLALQKEARDVIPKLVPHLGIFSGPLVDNINGEVFLLVPDSKRFGSPVHITHIELYAQGPVSRRDGVIQETLSNECFADTQCRTGFKEYMDLLKDVYSPASVGHILDSLVKMKEKDKRWTDYIDDARAQTFVDIAVTTFLYESVYGKQPNVFSEPPKIQWFALRPAAIIENVADALDGDQTKTGLALEVIGFNAWDDACFGLACGASVIVTHMDRAEVDDFGWGLSFHVENDYSFGFTRHGNDTGIFVTVDLLKLLIDKKSTFTQYKEKYRSIAN